MLEEQFIELVYKGSVKNICKFLKSNSIDIHTFKDSRGMTALQISSLNGTISVVQFLIEYSKSKFNSPTKLQE